MAALRVKYNGRPLTKSMMADLNALFARIELNRPVEGSLSTRLYEMGVDLSVALAEGPRRDKPELVV